MASWKARSDRSAASEEISPPETESDGSGRKSAKAELQGVAGAAAAARHSNLGVETRAFEHAMALQRSGRHAASLQEFERFLSRYPRSPLAQEAQVQRFRLLKRLGHDRQAAVAARKYMADHPRGFARGEAKDLALPANERGPRP